MAVSLVASEVQQQEQSREPAAAAAGRNHFWNRRVRVHSSRRSTAALLCWRNKILIVSIVLPIRFLLQRRPQHTVDVADMMMMVMELPHLSSFQFGTVHKWATVQVVNWLVHWKQSNGQNWKKSLFFDLNVCSFCIELKWS